LSVVLLFRNVPLRTTVGAAVFLLTCDFEDHPPVAEGEDEVTVEAEGLDELVVVLVCVLLGALLGVRLGELCVVLDDEFVLEVVGLFETTGCWGFGGVGEEGRLFGGWIEESDSLEVDPVVVVIVVVVFEFVGPAGGLTGGLTGAIWVESTWREVGGLKGVESVFSLMEREGATRGLTVRLPGAAATEVNDDGGRFDANGIGVNKAE